MNPTNSQILKLYKNLLRYGQNLKLTDKDYFQRRIQSEFRANKSLTEQSEVNFNFEKGITLLLRKALK